MTVSPIEVSVLGQKLRLNCPADQHEVLCQAAENLNERVKSMKERTGILSTERALSIVALNLSFELMQEQKNTQNVETMLVQGIQQLERSLKKVSLQKDNLQLLKNYESENRDEK